MTGTACDVFKMCMPPPFCNMMCKTCGASGNVSFLKQLFHLAQGGKGASLSERIQALIPSVSQPAGELGVPGLEGNQCWLVRR